ncbi:MAG: ATP-binding cassette domain-containing protein [Syntrophomonadaceae bacterium]|jgi:molybdate transport system ATP-binding protein|nr:ATP-binding cassette domain-containing protein [Syntrophomonadaceae bacterium]
MKSSLLEVSGLNVRCGKFKLNNITFSLHKKDYLIIVGPSGAGKTMLLETLAGLRRSDSGQIVLGKEEISTWPPEKRGFGFAYQDSLLYPFLNVRENILFGARAQKKQGQRAIINRLERLVDYMGIGHLLDRHPVSLSGGEKQRVSLARSILINPPVLLLDEPLSALDPQTRDMMRALLYDIHKTEGIGIIHVTHNFDEALQLGNQMIVMDQGRILQQGEPTEVFDKPGTCWVAKFLQIENIISGRMQRKNGAVWFDNREYAWSLGPLTNFSGAANSREVSAILHSWQIELSPPQVCDGKPNSWNAIVEKIIPNSHSIDLTCGGSGRWQISLSRKEWEKHHLEVGAQVTLSVDPEQVHFI